MTTHPGRPGTPHASQEPLVNGKQNGDTEHVEVNYIPEVETPGGCYGKACHRVLYVVDLFLCFVVFSVINVAFWRGSWGLLDLYLFPGEVDIEGDYEIISIHGSAVSFAVGACSRVLRVGLEPACHKLYNALRYGWAQLLAKIIYNFFDACLMIAQWRGLYNILDFYVGYDFIPNVIGLGVGTVILAGSRSFSSTLGLPMCLMLDSRKDFFMCWPRFRTERRRPYRFVLDHMYSLLVCESASILAWQAFWNCWDAFIDYEEGHYPLVKVLALGTLILLLMCAIQVPVSRLSQWLSRHAHWGYSLVLEDIYFFLILMGQMGYWVAVWEILQAYLLPHSELYACLATMFGGYTLLALFGITSVLSNSGIAVDLETQDGRGPMWETKYFEAFLTRRSRGETLLVTDTSQLEDGDMTTHGEDNPALEADPREEDSGVHSGSLPF